MTTIKTFIQQEILLPRLKKSGVLVLYDPARRYHALCLELATDTCQVIDTADSSITSRLSGLQTLQTMGQRHGPTEALLIYVPAKAPVTEEEKQRDPFAVYGAIGGVFPEGDGDEYLSLCLKAKPDHVTEIRRIFSNDPNPSFAVIDAVGGGAGWPTLQALLQAESARDILFQLLAPDEPRLEALKTQTTWMPEAKALFETTLGLPLKTKIESWSAIADELWRFLLFSEFVFDVPGNLPPALGNVPRAPEEARHLVYDLCDRLRNDLRTRNTYIERAESNETELSLPNTCRGIDDFGERDTFPFEERASFQLAVNALKQDDVDRFRQIINRHNNTVWVSRGENQAQWTLVKAAAALLQACDDADRQLGDYVRAMNTLVDYYTASLREVDRYQREFEQALSDTFDPSPAVIEVRGQARKAYRALVEKVQTVFLRHLEKTGWPLPDRLANADVFDRLIAPALQESGRRVALFLIDAMRYELGVELAKQIADEGQVTLQAACAQLPTVTPVGMASLLPGAGRDLRLENKEGRLAVKLGEQPLANVNQRMDLLQKRYGQRFHEVDLAKFVQTTPKLPGTVDLLVLRSNEMDNDFETNPEAAPGLISRTFQKIRAAMHKLRTLGFQEAFLVTDHGFYLNTDLEAGDVCARPSGNWVNAHDRMLFGDGSGDPANLVLPTEQMGIRGDFAQAATPRALVAYKAGQTYFHGGLSLQEALVPVITVRIRQPEVRAPEQLQVLLQYKRGSGKITTRLPVIEVSVTGQTGLFAGETSVDLVLEAHDAKGKVVGEAKPGGPVNPATGQITLKPGDSQPITLKMALEFEGKFFVKALDPATLAARGAVLELETDYTV